MTPLRILLNRNPSRGWYWWSLAESFEASPLVNGPVFETEAECLESAAIAAKRAGVEVAT